MRLQGLLLAFILLAADVSGASKALTCNGQPCDDPPAVIVPQINFPDMGHVPCDTTSGRCPDPFGLEVVFIPELLIAQGAHADSTWWPDNDPKLPNAPEDFIISSAYLLLAADVAQDSLSFPSVGLGDSRLEFCRSPVSPYVPVIDNSSVQVLGTSATKNKIPMVVLQQQDAQHGGEWFPRLQLVGSYTGCGGIGGGTLENGGTALRFPVSNANGDTIERFATDSLHPGIGGAALLSGLILNATYESLWPHSELNIAIDGSMNGADCSTAIDVAVGSVSDLLEISFDPATDAMAQNSTVLGGGCMVQNPAASTHLRTRTPADSVVEGQHYYFETIVGPMGFMSFELDLVDQSGTTVTGTTFKMSRGGFMEEVTMPLATRVVFDWAILSVEGVVPAGVTSLRLDYTSAEFNGVLDFKIDHTFGKIKAHQRAGPNYLIAGNGPIKIAEVADSMGGITSNDRRVVGAMSRMLGYACGTSSRTPQRTSVRPDLILDPECIADNLYAVSGRRFLDEVTSDLIQSYFHTATHNGSQFLIFHGLINDLISIDRTPRQMYDALYTGSGSLDGICRAAKTKCLWIHPWPTRQDTTTTSSRINLAASPNTSNTGLVINAIVDAVVTRTQPAE